MHSIVDAEIPWGGIAFRERNKLFGLNLGLRQWGHYAQVLNQCHYPAGGRSCAVLSVAGASY